jgi:multimeric flavodoxin WrbA
MDPVYDAIRRSNLVIWAMPMYWGYMTAQMKTLVDRMEAIASEGVFRGKSFVVILTYRHHYQSTLAFFERVFANYFRVGLHTISFRSVDATTGCDIHVDSRPDVLEAAYRLGKSLPSVS